MPFSGSSRPSGNGDLAPTSVTGTAVALYNKPKSARPFHAEQGLNGWGGARNRSDRSSDSLSLKQATGIIHAAQFAAAIGLPFNRHVTIHWERAGISDCEAARATARFLKLASDWIASRAGRWVLKTTENGNGASSWFTWVWVRENDVGGKGPKGSHVHILLHVPAELTWSGWQVRCWLERVTGNRYRAGVMKTARIGGSLRAAADNTAAYQANLAEVVSYLLKGASADVHRALGLARIESGGRVIGKRAATSQNIGLTARINLLKAAPMALVDRFVE